VREELDERRERTKAALAAVDEDTRQAMEGHRPGRTCAWSSRLSAQFMAHFDARRPVLVGAVPAGEEEQGYPQGQCYCWAPHPPFLPPAGCQLGASDERLNNVLCSVHKRVGGSGPRVEGVALVYPCARVLLCFAQVLLCFPPAGPAEEAPVAQACAEDARPPGGVPAVG